MPRIVYTDISGQERSVPFGGDYPVVSIGRATDCTIRSNRKSVSRRHAEFRYSNGQFEIIDLNSSNGTFVIINNERKPVVGREFLAINDEVWCGDFILHFVEDEHDSQAADSAFDAFAAPTQNGGNVSFAQSQPQKQDFGFDYDAPFHPGIDDYPRGIEEASSVAWGSTHPPTAVDGPDMTMERSSDMERLKAERQSIQELAERQSAELEELQRRLDAERRKVEDYEAKSERTSNVPLGDMQKLRDDVARLEDEKTSEAEQSRLSKSEISRLAAELDGVREEKRRLEEKLHTALQSSERGHDAEARLEETKRRSQNLEQELDSALTRVAELEEHLNSQANALEERQRFKENLLARDRDIEALETEVERLQHDLAIVSQQFQDASSTSEKGQRAIEETEALRREVERHKRLVEEFERQNRELTAESDELRSSVESAQSTSAVVESRIDDLESEIEATRAELEAMRRDRDRASQSLQDMKSKGSVEDLRNEIEGLKQRMKLEKERSKHDDNIAEQNADLQMRLADMTESAAAVELELEKVRAQLAAIPIATGTAAENLPPDVLREMQDRVDRLDRIVDAIERTALDSLSTVDRIRLQSALRDTEPRASLNHLKGLLGVDA